MDMDMATPGDLIELRGDLEREYVDVLDALAKATRRSRTEIWLKAVKEFCRDELHKASLVTRLSRRDGPGGD